MVLTSKACMEMLIKRTIKLLVGGRLPGRKFQDHFYAAVKDSLGSIFQVFSVRNFDIFCVTGSNLADPKLQPSMVRNKGKPNLESVESRLAQVGL